MSTTNNLKKFLLAGTAIVAVGAFSMPARAANLDPDGTVAAPTALNPDVSGADTINDTDNGANNAGQINVGASDETVASIAVGDNDASVDTYNLFLFGGNTFNVTGTTTLTADAGANDDILNFHVGAENSTPGIVNSTSVFFGGNVVGTGATINITYDNAANSDTVTFGGAIIDLGAGGVTFSNADDMLVFNRGADQAFTGTINGAGTVEVDNNTSFEGIIGGGTAVEGFDIVAGTATFLSNVTTNNNGDDFSLENGAGVTFDVQTGTAGAIAVTGQINGAADGFGTVNVVDSSTGTGDAVTFNSGIGDAGDEESIAALNIGASGTAGGSAIFGSTVNANDINIGFADTANNNVTAVFQSDVVANTIDIIGEATAGANNTTFEADVAANITITDAGTDANVIFDTETNTPGTSLMLGTINGSANGEGTVNIVDSNTGNAGGMVFDGALGDTGRLENVNIGLSTVGGGLATFGSTVSANNINIGLADMANQNAFVTFEDDVTATVGLNVTAEATGAGLTAAATFLGDVTAPIVLTDGAGGSEATIRFAGTDPQLVTGTIIGGGASQGEVYVGNGVAASNVTFTSVIGSTPIDFFSVTTAATANISNNLATDNTGTGVNVDGTLNIDASSNTVTVQNSTGDIDLNGTIGITGDNETTFAASNDLFIDGASTFTTTLTGGAHTVLAAAGDIVLAADDNTVFNLGNQLELSSGGDVLISDNDGFGTTFNIRKTADFDPAGSTLIDATSVTGAIDIDSDGVVTFAIDPVSDQFNNGDEILAVNGANPVQLDNVNTTWAALLASGDVVLQDTAMVDIVDDGSTAEDLLIQINFNDANDVFEGEQGAGAANALLAIDAADATGELLEIRGNLLTANAQQAQQIGEALSPTVDGGIATVVEGWIDQTANMNSNRLASLRNGTQTGMSGGDNGAGHGIWAKVFGTSSNQDARDGVDGYDSDTQGLAVGLDTQNLGDNAVVGIGFSYAQSDVDSDNANTTQSDIDSYNVNIYGEYDFTDRMYMAGQLGYTFGSNDVTRHNVGGLSGLNANGDFDSDLINARVEVGHDMSSGGGLLITPKVLANYMHYSTDSYTESGAGTANLNVDNDDLNKFELGAGVNVSWVNNQANGAYFEPGVHAGVRYDLVGDNFESTSSFTGGGAAFQTNGADPARTTGNVGLDLTYHAATNWDLKAGYDFEIKDDYQSHAGLVKAVAKF